MAFAEKHNEEYQRKLKNKIDSFSAKFMSDAKWLKLFKVISLNSTSIRKCYLKLIWGNLIELEIPATDFFSDTFTNSSIKDVVTSGPVKFKEIKSIEFPIKWKSGVVMNEQDINVICESIATVGQFEMEIYSDKLMVYGYK